MEKLFYEDYAVGEKLRSPGRTITETDIVMFSAFTGDWHPLHTNVEFAKKTIFGERIAHGMLTLCVGSALMFRLGMYAALPKSFIAFYGMDSVRFTGATKSAIRSVAKWKSRAWRPRTTSGASSPPRIPSRIKGARIWLFTRRRSCAAEDRKFDRGGFVKC